MALIHPTMVQMVQTSDFWTIVLETSGENLHPRSNKKGDWLYMSSMWKWWAWNGVKTQSRSDEMKWPQWSSDMTRRLTKHKIRYVDKKKLKWMLTWLVVGSPLWKIWVRELGWWDSQYMGKCNWCSKPPTSNVSCCWVSARANIQTTLWTAYTCAVYGCSWAMHGPENR